MTAFACSILLLGRVHTRAADATSVISVTNKATQVRRSAADILPKAAVALDSKDLVGDKIGVFLKNQGKEKDFQPSRYTAEDYLRIINGEVAVFRKCQDDSGKIIDPVMKIEWQYSTPCYALSVALLHASGYNADPSLFFSGLKAMDSSVNQMHEYKCAHNHGEFYLQPIMLALDLYASAAPKEKVKEWRDKISSIDPYKLHPDNLKRKKNVYNHNVVALAGEYLRIKHGVAGETDFFEKHLANQEQYLSDLGMYKDPNVPMVYDEFSRQYLATILSEGYNGPCAQFYRDRLWKGAWMSLFLQSPFGECPAGGRSAHHIWNEAQMAVTYEIFAAQYARHKDSPAAMAAAGAFKRAAHLSLGCIERWLRPDGSGYVVKNRYPIEAKHGYERYSAQSQYNLLACWLMAVAYLYSDETISERPAPAEVGGFVIPLVEDFHKVFANAGGAYIEYETRGDLHYNPTGLIRVHLKGSNPQLGPSDGVVHNFDPTTKADLGGENLSIGPAWKDEAGKEHRLADFSPLEAPTVEILKETADAVSFSISYPGHFGSANSLKETFKITPGLITVETSLAGPKTFRICYPMLVFDGLEQTRVTLKGNTAQLSLRDGSVRFTLEKPEGIKLQRAGRRLDFRNGEAEQLYAEIPGTNAVYSISGK